MLSSCRPRLHVGAFGEVEAAPAPPSRPAASGRWAVVVQVDERLAVDFPRQDGEVLADPGGCPSGPAPSRGTGAEGSFAFAHHAVRAPSVGSRPATSCASSALKSLGSHRVEDLTRKTTRSSGCAPPDRRSTTAQVKDCFLVDADRSSRRACT